MTALENTKNQYYFWWLPRMVRHTTLFLYFFGYSFLEVKHDFFQNVFFTEIFWKMQSNTEISKSCEKIFQQFYHHHISSKRYCFQVFKKRVTFFHFKKYRTSLINYTTEKNISLIIRRRCCFSKRKQEEILLFQIIINPSLNLKQTLICPLYHTDTF